MTYREEICNQIQVIEQYNDFINYLEKNGSGHENIYITFGIFSPNYILSTEEVCLMVKEMRDRAKQLLDTYIKLEFKEGEIDDGREKKFTVGPRR